MFSSYIFKIPFIALHLSHCPLIYFIFFLLFLQQECKRKSLTEDLKRRKYVEAGDGVGKADTKWHQRTQNKADMGIAMICVGSAKWK